MKLPALSASRRAGTLARCLAVGLVLPFLAVTGCIGVHTEEGAAGASASAFELGQMNRDFAAALNAHDAAKAAALYAEDAVMLPPGEQIIRGRAAIQAYWQAGIDAGVKDVSVVTLEAKSSGNQGYEIGTYRMLLKNAAGAWVVEQGKFVELLRRREDGKWISTGGIWNTTP